MLTVMAFHPGDTDQALRFATWLHELGPVKNHDLILIADDRCPAPQVTEIETEFAKSFRSVSSVFFTDHYKSWPSSPNAVFSFAARHVMANQKVPWLFCEPDCVPLKANWLDAIEAEYKSCGKPFLGARVEVNNVPVHMSGNAVYPVDMFTHAGLTLLHSDMAWDVVGAEQIVPQMHETRLIAHAWKHEPFQDWDAVQREVFGPHPAAVLWHSSKDGSLIRLLREQRQDLSSSTESRRAESSDSGNRDILQACESGYPAIGSHSGNSAPPAQTFTADLFIKTYPGDYPFLEYCVRSILKFASGFREVVIAYPKGTAAPPVTSPGFTLVQVAEGSSDTYLEQQRIKLDAWLYSNADYVFFIDSDTIFSRPVSPNMFLRDGKPIWMMTPFAALDGQERKWIAIMEKFMGKTPTHEFMRRMPFVIPRWLIVELRTFCQEKHGLTLPEYILAQPYREFSEYNIAGFYAHEFHRDRFEWVDTAETPESEWPVLCVDQRRSWDGVTDEIKAEWEEILNATPVRDVSKIDLRPLEGESVKDWAERISAGLNSSPSATEILKLWKQREQMASARAVLIAKREAGTVVRKKKRRKKARLKT